MKTLDFSHLLLGVLLLCAVVSCTYVQEPIQKNDLYEVLMTMPGTDMLLRPVENNVALQTKVEKTTHYRIKFYPKNIVEQQYLNSSDNISISYIPFGYELISGANFDVRTEHLSFVDVNPHNYYYEGYCFSGNELSYKKREVKLPVMYAVWPKEKKIPKDISHEVIAPLSLRVPPPDLPRYPLILRTYDSFLGRYVPLENIKVRISYQGCSADQYTDSNGFVQIYTGLASITSPSQVPSISVYVVTEGQKWSVCYGSSTAPYQLALGTIGSLWPTTTSTLTMNLTSIRNEYEIYRAAEFYFSPSNELSVITEEENPIIHTFPQHPWCQGETWPYQKIIYIYDVGLSQQEELAVVFHELGHIRKCYHQGMSNFNATELWVHESYSCFLGAYLGEAYYLSKGYVKPYSTYLINTMGQQHTWQIGSSSPYSPFFIDLFDEYNQSSYNANLPNDVIQGFPAYLVDNLGIYNMSKTSSKATLSNYVGIYCTQVQLNTFLLNY